MATINKILRYGETFTEKGSWNSIVQGHPTDHFGKLSVRKALNPL